MIIIIIISDPRLGSRELVPGFNGTSLGRVMMNTVIYYVQNCGMHRAAGSVQNAECTTAGPWLSPDPLIPKRQDLSMLMPRFYFLLVRRGRPGTQTPPNIALPRSSCGS